MRNKYCYINSGKKQYEFSARSKKEEKIFAKLQSCGSQNASNYANLKFDLKDENSQSSLVQRKTIDTIREQTLLPHPTNKNDSNDANGNAVNNPTFSRISLCIIAIMAKTFNVLFQDVSRLFVCIVVLSVFGYNLVLAHN